ncbi:CYTH domain-containing protein [Sunxiuqinia sp. A32]|uniref:CYTH domain-containing protein n=1 Tax=Sunxiuqinia sp. A32 TaxID=3461496 RepID=UPI0040452608
MAVEIERKFLVKEHLLPEPAEKIEMVQGYLSDDKERTIRIRISDDKAYLTIKGKVTGISRPEFEYEIPIDDAKEMLKLSVFPPVEKIRNIIIDEGRKWEVDFFHGVNEGLIVAEIELLNEADQISLPNWILKEVTGDQRYYNSRLAKFPFSVW